MYLATNTLNKKCIVLYIKKFLAFYLLNHVTITLQNLIFIQLNGTFECGIMNFIVINKIIMIML